MTRFFDLPVFPEFAQQISGTSQYVIGVSIRQIKKVVYSGTTFSGDPDSWAGMTRFF